MIKSGKLTLLICILAWASLTSTAFAQSGNGNENHTIVFDRGFFGDTYTVDGKESNVDEVENLLVYVPEANSKWNSGNVIRYVSWGIAGVGGFFIGYGIAESQSFDEDAVAGYKRTLGLGAAIVVAALIVEYIGNSRKDGAIELYNSLSGKNQTPASNGSSDETSEEKTSFNIQFGPTPQGGFGLAFNF